MASIFNLPQNVGCYPPAENNKQLEEGKGDLIDDISGLNMKEESKKSRVRDVMAEALGAEGNKEIEREDNTPLFKAIEDSNWESVMSLLLTGKTNEFSFFGLAASTDKDSDPKEQARTWIIGKDWWGNVTSRKLPIHAAVMKNAPIEVIKKLHEFHSNGVRCKDLDGNLPLHLSFKHEASDNVVAFLLKSYPEAVSVWNKAEHTPIEYATNGAGEIINMCIEQTNINAKREEAMLCQALETEKGRLTEILSQLSDIRDELDHLRSSKKKVPENVTVDKCEETTASDIPSTTESARDSVPEKSSKKKKSPRSSSKKKIPWNKKRSVAEEPRTSQTKLSGLSKKK